MTIQQAIRKVRNYVALAERARLSRKDLAHDVGECFSKIRSWRGDRQKKFAEALGVSESYVNKVEHGVLMPSPKVLEILANLNEKDS